MLGGVSVSAGGAAMLLFFEAVLTLLGLIILMRGRFRIGKQEVGNPIASLVGLLLTAILPACAIVSFALAVQERVGLEGGLTHEQFQEKYWWLDPVVAGGLLLLAGLMAALGLCPEDPRLTTLPQSQEPASCEPPPPPR